LITVATSVASAGGWRKDWATQDLVIEILRDEEGHMRTFERYLREFE